MRDVAAKETKESLELTYFEKCKCWMTPRACGLRYSRASQAQGKVFYDEQDEILSFRDCLDCEVGKRNAATIGKISDKLQMVIQKRKKRGPRKKRIAFTKQVEELGYQTEAAMFRGLRDKGMTQREIAKLLGCSRYVVETRYQQYMINDDDGVGF